MRHVGLYHHRECELHEMGEGHPEQPDRLRALLDRLTMDDITPRLEMHQAPLAAEEFILLAHEESYLANLKRASEQAAYHDYVEIDGDTILNPYSLQAAYRAVGAVVEAVNAVLDGRLDRAFCAVRPPGHHATRNQAMGFCLFNNIAIAALHAVRNRGLQRVLVVDFDVHHGNGTEDILGGESGIVMIGSFQHPLYPFSGVDSPHANVRNSPLEAGADGAVIREVVRRDWLPLLQEFQPELLLISAGFDAHRMDPVGGLRLVEDDYAWITQQLLHAVRDCAKGRVVSVLEGGYHLGAMSRSASAHIASLLDD